MLAGERRARDRVKRSRCAATLILAALTAALMSSADSLINAVAAVFVNDLYQPYVRRRASDQFSRYASFTRRIAAWIASRRKFPPTNL